MEALRWVYHDGFAHVSLHVWVHSSSANNGMGSFRRIHQDAFNQLHSQRWVHLDGFVQMGWVGSVHSDGLIQMCLLRRAHSAHSKCNLPFQFHTLPFHVFDFICSPFCFIWKAWPGVVCPSPLESPPHSLWRVKGLPEQHVSMQFAPHAHTHSCFDCPRTIHTGCVGHGRHAYDLFAWEAANAASIIPCQRTHHCEHI